MKPLSPQAVATALALAGLAGCAGTSPNLSSPQMQSPSLGAGALGARSVAGLPRGASLEASLPVLEPLKTPEGTFVAPPYLQLGDSAALGGRAESLALLWQAPAPVKLDEWSVEVRPARGGDWKKVAGALTARDLKAEGGPALTAVRAPLTGLEPGELFDYQVLQGGKPVFLARGRSRRPGRATQRFVVLGETGGDDRKIAYQAALTRPDFVCAVAAAEPGKLWPVFNSDNAGADAGAPLLRSVPLVVPGGEAPVWASPLNGPQAAKGAARNGSYSFDYGNAHWSVLDSAGDWSDPGLRAWLEKDLAAAKKSTWRFVALPGAPFHAAKDRAGEPGVRALCDLLQKYDVAVVFSGSVHSYQRSHPIKFVKDGKAEAKLTLDTAFDGVKKTQTSGILYIVDGGVADKKAAPDGKPQSYTAKLNDEVNSFTVADIDGKKLTVRQLAADGKEIDTFTVTR